MNLQDLEIGNDRLAKEQLQKYKKQLTHIRALCNSGLKEIKEKTL